MSFLKFLTNFFYVFSLQYSLMFLKRRDCPAMAKIVSVY